jgi:outer membrane protein assembly factor BamB
MSMITTKDEPRILSKDWGRATPVLRKLLPQVVAWMLSLVVCSPGMAWAQAVNTTVGINSRPVVEPTSGRRIVVHNTLEIETSGHGEASINSDIEATLLHPANTPRINTSTAQAPPSLSVTTYHFDNRRNGWNNAESVLTPANVGSSSFNLLHSVPLDEQVDSQPLILASQPIAGQGTHDVVYVATDNNSLYAIDATTGAVLLQRNFGPAVPVSNCGNNSVVVGIDSTPVIDPTTGFIYVMVYTWQPPTAGTQSFVLHAINPSTLQDAIPPKTVSASHKLSDGSTYSFQAAITRQRPGLLAQNGNIYAGFSTFCDQIGQARGWILGWNSASLTPLPSNFMTDLQATSVNTYFLSSVWMSGYGLAAEGAGNLMFSTGNSDKSGTSYSPTLNLSESAVKIDLNLTQVKDFFTPYNVAFLDQHDADLGSGGLMALPTQPGFVPYLLVAGGKQSDMYLLNRTFMGKFTAGGPDQIVGDYQMGTAKTGFGLCECGPSYFGGSDGIGRIVSSGGNQIIVWRLQTFPSKKPTLVQERLLPSTQFPVTLQDGGNFTTISSNGTLAGSAIIWTVRRPVDPNTRDVTLYAFDPSTGATLFTQTAGTWPQPGNANIVPVPVNGKVYVASYKQLAIFGIGPAGATIRRPLAAAAPLPVGRHRVSGTVVRLNDDTVTIRTRTGRLVAVLATEAIRHHKSVLLSVGENIQAEGSYDADDALLAATIFRTKEPAGWAPDQ